MKKEDNLDLIHRISFLSIGITLIFLMIFSISFFKIELIGKSVQDIPNVTITDVKPDIGEIFNQSDFVKIEAKDPSGMSIIKADIKWALGNETITLEKNGSIYSSDFSNTALPGNYSVTITADNSIETISSETWFSVENTVSNEYSAKCDESEDECLGEVGWRGAILGDHDRDDDEDYDFNEGCHHSHDRCRHNCYDSRILNCTPICLAKKSTCLSGCGHNSHCKKSCKNNFTDCLWQCWYNLTEVGGHPNSAIVCDVLGCRDRTERVSYDDGKTAVVIILPIKAGYLEMNWTNMAPQNATLTSLELVMQHLSAGKKANYSLLLFNGSKWVKVANLNKSSSFITESFDLTEYINLSKSNNLTLRYYGYINQSKHSNWGFGFVDWAKIIINYTFVKNNPPSKVVLYSPLNGNFTFNRKPIFIWDNSTDFEKNALTYQIIIANNSNFSAILINASNINESSPRTNYTPEYALPVDTVLYWKVRAYDGFNYGNWSDVWNFTVKSSLIVSLPIKTVDFGSMKPGESNSTENNSPLPLLVQNDGNVNVDVIVEGSSLWASVSNPSKYYQYKIGVNEGNSFNSILSTLNWTHMPLISFLVDIADLKYDDESDNAEIELNITVPGDEPPGAKNSTITITAEAA